MSEDKLRSDEVPQKFAEWLLTMGCPPENVPPVDKISEMCRGQYYMVWRSLMEKVEAKDDVRRKRLQVFCDDMKKCQKNKVFNERDINMIVPEELSLWEQHSKMKEKVADAEVSVIRTKENLHQLMDKVSSKLAQRNLANKRLQDSQRRAWLLYKVSEELKDKRVSLQETKSIAESLCGLDDGADIENKVEKCVVALSRQSPGASSKSAGVSLVSAANPAACSSIASTNSENNDAEEVISSLVKCRGDALYKQLYEKRAGLCVAIPASYTDKTVEDANRVTPQSVLSHTAALHCIPALEAVKNRVHIKHTRNRLATSVNELSNYLSGEACELLVIRCERARSEARLASLRASCEEVASRSGLFETGSHQAQAGGAAKQIHSVDRAIESKRDELKRLITSVATIERKTQNVRECLVTCFNSFHDDAPHGGDRLTGRSSFPQDSVMTLRQFYEEKSERRKNKVDLSMDFDSSDNYSFTDPTENGSPKFIDELKFYLKKFNLENNRKLVLENGEKIWVFETLKCLIEEVHMKMQNDDIATSLLCPSLNLKQNLRHLARVITRKTELEEMVRVLDSTTKKNAIEIDISSTTEEEQRILDKIKKRLNENIINLQKTNKTLDIGVGNLQLWSNNDMKKYISMNRTVDGKTYREYEDIYLETLRM